MPELVRGVKSHINNRSVDAVIASEINIFDRHAFIKIYGCLMLLAILVNWPGRVFPDTVDMLWQAQNPEYVTDWHSPFITFLYGLLWPLFGYPGGALVFQSLLLMLWPASVLHALLVSHANYYLKIPLLFLWVLVCSIIIALAGQIVKDVCVLGFYSVMFYLISRRNVFGDVDIGNAVFWIYLIGFPLALSRVTNLLVLFACGLSVVGFLLFKSLWRAKYFLHSAAMAALVVIVIVNSGYIFGARKSQPERSPIIFDLAGISYFSGENQFIFDSEAKFKRNPIDCYTPKQSDPFIWGGCGEYDLYLRSRSDIQRHWLLSIINHPVDYLRHRISFSVELLKKDGEANELLVPNPPFVMASNTVNPNLSLLGGKFPKMELWHPTIGYMPFGLISSFLLSGILGHPLLWCIILIINFMYVIRRKVMLVPLLLSVAGMSNVIAFILLSGSDDLRYLLPTLYCALAVIVYWGGKFMFRFENLRSGPKG